MQSTLTFYGGAGSVTGANFLLKSDEASILVDCGMRQGCAYCEKWNWEPFSYDPSSIDVLIVTHAHIDHIGRIPKLVKDGFKGRIFSTEATRAIAEPLLEDAAMLAAHDAKEFGHPPLYDSHDIDAALRLWTGIGYHEAQALPDGFSFEFMDAGHILGSAMAKVSRGGRNIVFTGDLGSASVLLPAHESVAGADYILMESVYGDRAHEVTDPHIRRDGLRKAIVDAAKRGGTLLIPAFATERTQDLLFEMRTLFMDGGMPDIPVYLDAPLGKKVTHVFLSFPQYFRADIAARIQGGENIFSFPQLHIVESTEESAALRHKTGAKVIIAGSGMSQGGRVLAHEREILTDRNAVVLMVGYQAAGSLGRKLLEGLKEVTVMGERVKVRCSIQQNLGYSAHMDGPHLLDLAAEAADSVEHVFVVMGEPASAGFLAQRINDRLGVKATAPEVGDSATLNL